ncbi:MFS general substrate transporter [Cryphonectria parasitica EP155]|uniref:MFS general substrate transporter n=1 Tax=Cryphonectria parasitica (strain ATCC 38755 / EP155) TaxID=660469 RepID=A0A9P5CNT3_CRYP1|nr:MFS general substrate transporter [Cryphonectria parasitica EP155]KAF3764657.1 MFS general substrate transporter [Cryphonectria parasitica EP155]
MDETSPLLSDAATAVLVDDRIPNKDIVDFDPDGDAENPMDWPTAYKWGIVTLLAAMAFTVTFTCISVVPIANIIVDDLEGGDSDGSGSGSAAVLLVTIWELGEAAGPLFIAPLSELYGRYPVINAANALFIAFTALTALSPSTDVIIVSRALTGLAVASNVLAPAIVGDMFPSEQRGAAMSLIQLAPLTGGAIGPAIAGAISQTAGWRECVWMAVALAVACEVVFLTLFRETYKIPILRRKAARLRKETGNLALRTVYDSSAAGTHSWTLIWESIMRPTVVLRSSFVLQILSFYGSFLFSYFYIMSTTLPGILQDIYHFTPAATGVAFITFSVGSALGVVIVNTLLDRIYVRLRDSHKGIGQPEYRLPLVIVGSFLFPTTVLLYGWSTQLRLPVVVLLLTVAIMGTFLMLSFVPVMAYVVDAFGVYSASSVTALIVTRCLMGTFLPLTAQPAVDRLGYGWGMTVFAAISVATIPIPLLVYKYGYKWRQTSKYTRDE